METETAISRKSIIEKTHKLRLRVVNVLGDYKLSPKNMKLTTILVKIKEMQTAMKIMKRIEFTLNELDKIHLILKKAGY
jgi:hypothetical protein